MLSRRKLFGFLAAAPVVGAVAAKAAQPERSFFKMRLDPADFKPVPFEIDTDLDGNLTAAGPSGEYKITIRNPSEQKLVLNMKEMRMEIYD